MPTPRRSLGAWLDGPWVRRELAEEAFAHQREIDPFGHRVHVWCACLACAGVAGPPSWVDILLVPVVLAFLIRAHRHLRTWLHLLGQPLVLLVVAVMAWGVISLSWTGDVRQGLDDLGTARYFLAALAIWPACDRRALLIASMAAGFAIGQGVQFAQLADTIGGIGVMPWPRDPGRHSGWWDPVVGGTMLTGALGLHLPAATMGRGRARAVGIAGASLASLGVFASGTRGAWIAGLALAVGWIVAAIVRAAWTRAIDPPAMARRAVVVLAIGAVVGVVSWVSPVGREARARTGDALVEVRRAIRERDFDSNTGARLLMNWWAVEAMAERPLTGVGSGGFAPWARAHLRSRGIDPGARRIHAHAHNALLHAGATLGLPGAAMALGVAFLAVRGAGLSRPGDAPGAAGLAPLGAMLGLLGVSVFDTIQLNAQSAAFLGVLLPMCVAYRPGATRA